MADDAPGTGDSSDFRPAGPGDWLVIERLLADAGLPTDDLAADRLDHFLVAEEGGRLTGLIGLEIAGTHGLLRSLVVAEDRRGTGLGGLLVNALEDAAMAAKIPELWLLTIDAERFFQRHGFHIVARQEVPDAIRGTREFGELCPGTAFAMRKSLLRR